ncbi:hypothetical protein Baya_4422 [Bagarius yarrelli]|uniref:Uncharacterized protein n=1 Tax=Bagarius yarrelli TaxID=175774 RepID=A0A556TQ34_BAGYA|nr:hypothetical protein Baya_4422 [Bagarius yarrelli]
MLMQISVGKDASFHMNNRDPFPHAAECNVPTRTTNSEQASSTNRTHCQGIKGFKSTQDGGVVKVTTQSRASWLVNTATSQAEISADMKFYLPMRSVFADSFRA